MAGFDPKAYAADDDPGFDPKAYTADDADPPGLIQRVLGKLPDSFGNYTPGATPAQASLDNPDATKKFAVAGTGLAGGEILAPLTGGLSGPAGIAARVGTNAAVGDAVQVGNNAVDNKPLSQGLGKSTLIGIGAGAGAEGVSGAAGYFSGASSDYAADKAAKALGMTKADYVRLGPDKARALGQSAMDQGFIPLFATPAKIEAATDAAKEAAGQNLGKVIDQSQAQLDQMSPTGMMQSGKPIQATPVQTGVKPGTAAIGGTEPTIVKAGDSGDFITPITPRPAGSIDAPALAKRLQAGGDSSKLAKVPGMEGLANKINSFTDTLAKNPQAMNLRDAQSLRQGIDSAINWGKGVPEMAGTQKYLVNIRNSLSDAMSQAVDQAAARSGTPLGALKQANQNYSTISKINDIASNRAAMNAANRAVSLTDTISGAGGAGVGATVGGLAAGPLGAEIGGTAGFAAGAGANKLARTYAPAIQANAANQASKVVGAVAKTNLANPATVLAQNLNQTGASQTLPYDSQIPANINRTPAKGEDLWAQQGIRKLGINDSNMANRLLQDPKAKQLLVQASDLSPGSKAMKNIMNQIQKGWGQ